jgi:hypothetical protein
MQTIYLSNWSSPKFHGTGRIYTIMARPRAWEHGDGAASWLIPRGAEVDLLQEALRLKNHRSGGAAMRTYRRALEARWTVGIALLGPTPEKPTGIWGLTALYPDGEIRPVLSGDTLCCACAVDAARSWQCHRSWAAPFLAAMGWRVMLDGREWVIEDEEPHP